MGKLLRVEITTMAKRIVKEVDNNNKQYNIDVVNSHEYQQAIKEIKSKSTLIGAVKTLERSLRSKLGNNFADIVELKLTPVRGSQIEAQENVIKKEIADYQKTVFKPRFYRYVDSEDMNDNVIQRVVDDITIAQMSITDVQDIITEVTKTLS